MIIEERGVLMKQHILLDKAVCYPDPIEIAMPKNHTFVESSGYWIDNYTGEIMMLSTNPQHLQTKNMIERLAKIKKDNNFYL